MPFWIWWLSSGCRGSSSSRSSEALEVDVAGHGRRPHLDVSLAVRRRTGRAEGRPDTAGRGADVGPHRRTVRDAEADVAGDVLEARLAAGHPADPQVAGGCREGCVLV